MSGRVEEGVLLALKDDNISDYTITKCGNSGKSDGYLGNISFISVDSKNIKGKRKTLDLVIKTSKESKTLRKQTPIREAFVKEIFIYDRVLKAFHDLQNDKNLLEFLPYCYATQISNDGELLVFEDLKKQGYDTWDRNVPLTYEHIKLVLQAYGKWHGFSYALRQKRRDVFQELIKDNVNMFVYFFKKVDMVDMTLQLYLDAKDICVSPDEKELMDKLQMSIDDAMYIFTDLLFEDLEHSVISHGDSWSNNFLFKFDHKPTQPTSVRILDWQCAGLTSPVCDLSHFIYGCCDTEKYKDVSKFLKIYYESLQNCLKSLGCDPEKVFPYSKLLEHWKRFSKYGILLQPFVLKFAMCDAEDAPDFAEAAEQGKDFLDNFNIAINKPDVYYKRIRANFVHYVKNLKLEEDIIE